MNAAAPCALSLRDVSLSFGAVPVLAGLTLEVRGAGVTVVLGPSGSGKTSLLRLAAGLIAPDLGAVSIAGRAEDRAADGTRGGARVGVMFQEARLLPWATVRRNLEFALLPLKLSRAQVTARIDTQLARLGIADLAARMPAQVSGGQKQRVALARALIVAPRVLLMDEPFASLDALLREDMQDELLRVLALQPASVVFVTHSVDEALYLADRIVVLGGGKILADVAVTTPRPRRVPAGEPLGDDAALRADLRRILRGASSGGARAMAARGAAP
ncbi:Sulfate/thiosulfate import ATP-binding protein CysA [Aquimixticola soesokkakensis]|uniref:Sulfate/thiosulfate import ATP-binding protein CysA n=1 Tax=Aquimixticola soesokkakensis TaxID=1519096 RepID=A0A1Y5TGQ7_9RHOB|nr:ABC transporter ATP-binding protein [Aquimixticola soesokkakensis]SLN63800.1 Sulfate/thiosulfate import ATP-binding protein CysA [Aquimixticola soesokkakensis]